MTDPMAYAEMAPEFRLREARDAVTRSQQRLAETMAANGEVTRVTTVLRNMRAQNRYGERMAQAMRSRSE